jgi:DNA-binding MarR family transcriptional regulator
LVDYITVLTFALLAVTAVAAWEYYRHILKAHREYVRARDAVEDIILSINREMRREASKLESMEYKIAGVSGKIENALKREDTVESKIAPIENSLASLENSMGNASTKIDEVTNRIGGIEKSFEALKERVNNFEEQVQRLPSNQEIREQPVIQLRRDKAIGPLTDTEISVLEMLSKEGAKTAPEIKDTVKLSREHTARLMKKLYEGGYVERETGKIPFRYSLKREMEKLLRKPEAEPA